MLERGEGVPFPAPDLAARYWRMLADAGDAEAAEKVGLAIRQRKARPATPTEMVDRLSAAARQGRLDATLALAELDADSPAAGSATRAMDEALAAYRLAAAKVNDTADGIVRQRDAALLAQRLAARGVPFARTAEEQSAMASDFAGDGKSWALHVPARCSDGKTYDVRIVVWSWPRDYPPSDPQVQGLEKAYHCSIDAATADALHRLYLTARQKNQDFVDLVYSELDPMGQVMAKMSGGTVHAPAAGR
jgi:hypothetical protein